jgi:hypothetical protein
MPDPSGEMSEMVEDTWKTDLYSQVDHEVVIASLVAYPEGTVVPCRTLDYSAALGPVETLMFQVLHLAFLEEVLVDPTSSDPQDLVRKLIASRQIDHIALELPTWHPLPEEVDQAAQMVMQG